MGLENVRMGEDMPTAEKILSYMNNLLYQLNLLTYLDLYYL